MTRSVSLGHFAADWNAPSPILAAAILGSLLLFGQAFFRLRRRGRADHASLDRPVLFLGGIAITTLALVSPLDAIGERYLLSGHMIQHLLIGDAAPALMVLAVRGPLVFFLLPAPALRPLAGFRSLRRASSFLLRPSVSVGGWLLAFGGWHVPAAYEFALHHALAHDLEHASFVFTGILVWTQLVDPTRHGRLSPGRRAALAGLLLVAGQALSDVLLATGPLYQPYASQPDRLLGLSAAADQARAGLVMMGEQIVTLGTAAALLVWLHVERLGAAQADAEPSA